MWGRNLEDFFLSLFSVTQVTDTAAVEQQSLGCSQHFTYLLTSVESYFKCLIPSKTLSLSKPMKVYP